MITDNAATTVRKTKKWPDVVEATMCGRNAFKEA